MVRTSTLVAVFFALCSAVGAAESGAISFGERTETLTKKEGMHPVWVDPSKGTLLLELPAQGTDGLLAQWIYVESLAHGLGSNPIGLDRGQLGEAVMVDARRVGNRVIFQQPNLDYRALQSDSAEARAVTQSFATSILWSTPIVAEEEGRLLIDLKKFLLRDAHSVVGTLAATGQGSYRLDAERSVVDLDALLTFPRNLEFEALLTYAGAKPGRNVREVTPAPESITLVQHHSLIALPEAGYKPRRYDPRAGSFAIQFSDYAVPLDAPLERRWIVRHRLEKVDPTKARSKVKQPIVYYLDRGTPEPVRQALLDGARWWAEAFDAAGFVDAFRVEMLPEGAHPLDVRYNMIQWVHRSTRGWSYGGGVTDPRTGEMIKGHVSLGSLRVRQDRLIFEGLLGATATGSGAEDDPIELALARIRQLSAHEVGHTLGISHNFAASSYGRESVMDYPAPWIRLRDGKLVTRNAYDVGVGRWDVHAVRYAYSEFAPGVDESEALAAIIQDGFDAGLTYLTDQDARPAGAAHPLANLWDNGSDAVDELYERLKVRRYALVHFDLDRLGADRPLALLEEVLAPIYFHHRFQLDAAAKLVGGVDYRYQMPGDGQPSMRPVPAERQRLALEALLELLDPQQLDLSDELLSLVVPRPADYRPNRELFRGRTAPLFDPIEAAATAADQAISALLQPQRAARVVDQARRDRKQLTFEELLEAMIAKGFASRSEGRLAEVQLAVQEVLVDRLVQLSQDSSTSAGVRSRALAASQGLLDQLSESDAADRYLANRLVRALKRPLGAQQVDRGALSPPPGSPIGSDDGCSWQLWPTEVAPQPR